MFPTGVRQIGILESWYGQDVNDFCGLNTVSFLSIIPLVLLVVVIMLLLLLFLLLLLAKLLLLLHCIYDGCLELPIVILNHDVRAHHETGVGQQQHLSL